MTLTDYIVGLGRVRAMAVEWPANLQLVLSILGSYSNDLVRAVLMLTKTGSSFGWSVLRLILLLLLSRTLLRFIHHCGCVMLAFFFSVSIVSRGVGVICFSLNLSIKIQ